MENVFWISFSIFFCLASLVGFVSICYFFYDKIRQAIAKRKKKAEANKEAIESDKQDGEVSE